jgi:peptidase E
MKAFLAGGGRFDLETERLPLLNQALAMAGPTPRLLIIPTPLKWPPFDELDGLKHYLTASKHEFKTLTPSPQAMPNYHDAAALIAWANVILIPGGNFTEQMARWRKTGIDQLLIKAAHTNSAVFVGGSTGLMCWFDRAQTNTHLLSRTGPSHTRYRLEKGLGVLPALVCAHYESFHARTGLPRAMSFREALLRQPTGTVGIGVSTHAAIEINGNNPVRITGQDRYATVHRIERTAVGLLTSIFHNGDNIEIPLNNSPKVGIHP